MLFRSPIAYYLSRFKPQAAIPIAEALYLIGLGGESYYGLISNIPVLSTFYRGIFQVFDYTRNGLFYVPLFLLLGGGRDHIQPKDFCHWVFAQFRFAMIAPVIQGLYPDASRTAYYERITEKPLTLPDGSTARYSSNTLSS